MYSVTAAVFFVQLTMNIGRFCLFTTHTPEDAMQMDEKYATLNEVARRWGIPVSWLYERSRRNELPGQKRLGRHIRIDLELFRKGVEEGVLAIK